jgi:hypothetical protein
MARERHGGWVRLVCLRLAALTLAACGDTGHSAKAGGGSGGTAGAGGTVSSNAGDAGTATGGGSGGTATGGTATGGAGGGTGGIGPSGGAGGADSDQVGTLGDACSAPGTLACAGHYQKVTLICGGNHAWQFNQTCGVDYFCDSTPGVNAGTCLPVLTECATGTAGRTFCSGNSVLQCGPDNVTLLTLEQCPDGCANGACLGAGIECTSANDCAARIDGRIECDVATGLCVECLSSADCDATERCLVGACAAPSTCTSTLDCPISQICDVATQRCVDCVGNTDCGPGFCVANRCWAACASDRDCVSLGLLCDSGLGHCVECLRAFDCSAGQSCTQGVCVPN